MLNFISFDLIDHYLLYVSPIVFNCAMNDESLATELQILYKAKRGSCRLLQLCMMSISISRMNQMYF